MNVVQKAISEITEERREEIRARTGFTVSKRLDGPKIIFLVGPPASGKSTWRSDYEPDRPTTVISSDDIVDDYAARNDLTYAEAFGILGAMEDGAYLGRLVGKNLRIALEAKHDIIIDRTNMTTDIRARMMEQLPKRYLRVAVVFDVPRDELFRRLYKRAEETGKVIADEVVNGFIETYEPPTFEEFDFIL